MLPGAMLSGCGGLLGSGVLGGVVGACWGIPSTLSPSILTLWMGSPRCMQTERNCTSGMPFSGEAAPIYSLDLIPSVYSPKAHRPAVWQSIPFTLKLSKSPKMSIFFPSLDTRSCSVPDRAPMLPKGSRNLANLTPLSFKALILQSISSTIS